jgi:hypothetical protein
MKAWTPAGLADQRDRPSSQQGPFDQHLEPDVHEGVGLQDGVRHAAAAQRAFDLCLDPKEWHRALFRGTQRRGEDEVLDGRRFGRGNQVQVAREIDVLDGVAAGLRHAGGGNNGLDSLTRLSEALGVA